MVACLYRLTGRNCLHRELQLAAEGLLLLTWLPRLLTFCCSGLVLCFELIRCVTLSCLGRHHLAMRLSARLLRRATGNPTNCNRQGASTVRGNPRAQTHTGYTSVLADVAGKSHCLLSSRLNGTPARLPAGRVHNAPSGLKPVDRPCHGVAKASHWC